MVTKNLSLQSSIPLSHPEMQAIQRAYSLNRVFFGYDLRQCSLTVCHTADEWRRESRYYYYPQARGVVLRDGSILVKSKRLADRSLPAWEKIVTHEINHSFWRQSSAGGKNMWSPIWLVEGLACHVARNDVLLTPRAFKKQLAVRLHSILPDHHLRLLPYQYRAALFPTAAAIRLQYSLWANFVGYLLQRNPEGLKRLWLQMKELASKQRFEEAFYSIWGAELQGAFTAFLKSVVHVEALTS